MYLDHGKQACLPSAFSEADVYEEIDVSDITNLIFAVLKIFSMADKSQPVTLADEVIKLSLDFLGKVVRVFAYST